MDPLGEDVNYVNLPVIQATVKHLLDQARQVHAQAVRENCQEGIDHPVQGVEDRPDDRKKCQLPA